MTRWPQIIVLDDDPTGTQTVHGVDVYTQWSKPVLTDALRTGAPLFFVLTNSRSFSRDKTVAVHQAIGENIAAASKETGRPFLVISRSDSTLRGHYPIETESLKNGLGTAFDGEVIAPFFEEGGRYTIENVHYLRKQDALVPVGETEFARDTTFGYQHSHLGAWVEEKTKGLFKKENWLYIPAGQDVKSTLEALMSACGFQKIIVNASTYQELTPFLEALNIAWKAGKRFLFRTAASFVKAIGAISDKPQLARAALVDGGNTNGGLVVIGSHVQRTTAQLQMLLDSQLFVTPIEFNQHLACEEGKLQNEADRVSRLCEESIRSGKTAVVYTNRQRLDLPGGEDRQLSLATEISGALVSVVSSLRTRPRYLVAKGGITTSDIATQALRIKRARVIGQIRPGIPVWSPYESKFPRLPFIVFPGNVGSDETLLEIVSELET